MVAVDVGETFVAELLERRAEAAFIALHGGEGEDGTVQGLLEAIGVPYTGSGQAACMRSTDKVLAKQLMREAGDPDAALPRLAGAVDQRARRGGGGASGSTRTRPPAGRQAGRGGSALGVKFARDAEELPAAIVGAFSYGRKILLERYVRGRDLAVSVLDGPEQGQGPLALPVVEAIPREEDFYDYESRYEIGMTTFVCPAELPPRRPPVPRRWPSGVRAARLPRPRAGRPDARAGHRAAVGARDQRGAGA